MVGDFNGRIGSLQTQYFDEQDDPLHIRALDWDDELQQASDDIMPLSTYGRSLLELREIHDLVILNGLTRFPHSCHHICFPHAGGSSVVDYILVSLPLVSLCQTFCVAPYLPLANHAHLILSFTDSLPISPCQPITLPPTHRILSSTLIGILIPIIALS